MDRRQKLIRDLELNISIIIRRFKKEMSDLFGSDITNHEFLFLHALSKHQPQMISALAKELNVATSFVTVVTDKLIHKGYINRERSEKDRRIVELTLTKEGNTLCKQMEKIKNEFMLKNFEEFTIEELEILLLLISKWRGED
ncbi:MarR family winged helix-turn-helix transcriptional regulator [Terrilactibacillus laevilacticus]|uniref:MarR family winged helix-turn-helix transcriptional regulator n=1 Tax=Terrilactibacillus laevilacticus TaxID=1380157 RepID=A0ABW5PQG7_9BACI|nr:MarR family transcriptional regulator [Terrilactibacillus laevilacticus]